jgi:hypothetical protein
VIHFAYIVPAGAATILKQDLTSDPRALAVKTAQADEPSVKSVDRAIRQEQSMKSYIETSAKLTPI